MCNDLNQYFYFLSQGCKRYLCKNLVFVYSCFSLPDLIQTAPKECSWEMVLQRPTFWVQDQDRIISLCKKIVRSVLSLLLTTFEQYLCVKTLLGTYYRFS